jgi:hypothetical protein
MIEPTSKTRTRLHRDSLAGVVIVALCALLPGALLGQSPPPRHPCSTGIYEPDFLRDTKSSVADVFGGTDTASIAFRQSHGMKISDSTSGRLITNSITCSEIRRKVAPELKNIFVPPLPLDRFDPLFFRFGDYYGVLLLMHRDPNGRMVNSYSPLLIYRAFDMRYLGFILM